ncbi:hypothetical protein A3I99_00235 [Candidatus Kaiserbacteria bacterium RIFCSPLOWO2_02_FULL_45_11b]|uniref:Uncharacterized protein n=1 Tax=Candidatus Kaiserbacteria bacterium RIFCSPLOWO2_12_FULL_45_26 TaxID=1798525 RepID=A0A1F6FGE8_9BACT|nr:MAG: hypothetical protein A2Z56_00560 [Candidatus Kaiserbacteria bacterium RIFCSPHIGHO2_12_45_16]OGG71007.1 MAG: hypothetical protein A2929_01605 [Candidatus Kaiserbacteria bacterium RIFCSPLOWO2_01_FULL_45_25]OGG84214.1 MAG: hypothetical protein A3I99_00235 [Candidatus Kaiserbacteria bacterium RIFCSPLOWO2_02_FULL_45_11b]OGG84933.1 MAG: hypothetical protein A3G90_02595 [Candidatus Kaiserbacteria bacterium RIFCSPLOWO2_12_FULL_45_26]
MYQDLITFTKSKSFQGILIGIVISIVALGIFQTGVMVGEHKARFSHHFGDNFERNFIDANRPGAMPFAEEMGDMRLPVGHGSAGEVVSVTLPTFVVAGPDNVEKTIRVSDETLFREFREELSSEDIVIGSFVVVLGSPNEGGEIEATLVRFLPPPPDFISNDRSE